MIFLQDEQGANNAIKKHEQLQKTVENYATEIRGLGERCQALLEANHPESEAVVAKQARIDKMYAGLRDLCSERRARLDEILKLYHLLRDILDLEVSSFFLPIVLDNSVNILYLLIIRSNKIITQLPSITVSR